MKRSPMKQGSAPMKRTGFLRTARKEDGAIARVRNKVLKSKQRAVTPDEKLMWDRLAQLGCVACMKDGSYNPHVSIHHCDGRTKPGCHALVLPLCGPHHQDDGSGALAIHPWKARFEARYGTQAELMAMCQELLKKGGRASAATETRPDQTSMENILTSNILPDQQLSVTADEAEV